jgi:hypothetical protein
MGERIYTPKFDITTYDFNKKIGPTTVDEKKVSEKLIKMTNDKNSYIWWFVLIIVLIVILSIPLTFVLIQDSD